MQPILAGAVTPSSEQASEPRSLTGAPAGGSPALVALGASLREHSLLIAIIACYLLVGMAIPWWLGRDLHFSVGLGHVSEIIWTISFWCVLSAGLVGFVLAALRRAGGSPLAAAARWLRVDFLRADRIWGGIIVVALLPVFAWNFGFLEALIPVLHKFTWDQTFADWDRWLHFGRQPWEWLQPVLGFPIVTASLSAAYASWFFVLYALNVAQAFQRRDPVTRMQYLLCTTLIWMIIGNLFGTVFSSAGPEYFGRVTGLADPFQPLMDYLRSADRVWPVYTVGLQDKMWQLYLVNGDGGVINGNVTAMPSLHVATAFSFYLVGRTMHPVLGWVLGIFAAIILIATIHLGWHYAIDGYAGILGTLALWAACGWLLRWRPVATALWGRAAAGMLARAAALRSGRAS
jgi:membrane-associated phospholipid phosphatase